MSEERLRRELEGAYRSRAHIYRLIYEELAAEVGAQKAEQVLSRAMERRGRDAAVGVFKPLDGRRYAAALGEFFVARSPDNGRLYPSSTERRAGGISISVQGCPLKAAWNESGVAPDTVETLCRIAGAYDRGLFEAAGVKFANETWRAGREGCCRIHLDDPR